MISWLSIKTNPPTLDTEIIVKRSDQLKWDAGIYSKLMIFKSSEFTNENMIDALEETKFDLWSDVT